MAMHVAMHVARYKQGGRNSCSRLLYGLHFAPISSILTQPRYKQLQELKEEVGDEIGLNLYTPVRVVSLSSSHVQWNLRTKLKGHFN